MPDIPIPKHVELPAADDPSDSDSVEDGANKLFDDMQNDIDLSSVFRAQMSLAILFAVWTTTPVLLSLSIRLRKQLRQPTANGQHWYTYIYLPGRMATATAVKVKTASLAFTLFVAAGIILLAFYATEAIIGGTGGDLSSWGDASLNLVSALRYFGFAFPDLCIVTLLLVVVKDRPELVDHKDIDPYEPTSQPWNDLYDLFLLFLSVVIVIAVFVCYSLLGGALVTILLRHFQTLLYLLLVTNIIIPALKFRKVLLKYDLYDQHIAYALPRFTILLGIRSLEYLIYYIIAYALPQTKSIGHPVLWVVNFGITGFITMLLFHCIRAAYPPLPSPEPTTGTKTFLLNAHHEYTPVST